MCERKAAIKVIRSCRKIMSSFFHRGFVEWWPSFFCWPFCSILLFGITVKHSCNRHFWSELIYGLRQCALSRDVAHNKWWLYFELHTKWSINGFHAHFSQLLREMFFICHDDSKRATNLKKYVTQSRHAERVPSWTKKKKNIQFDVALMEICASRMLISALLFGTLFCIVFLIFFWRSHFHKT